MTVEPVNPDQSEFESLLDWLSEDREHAGEVYEGIRRGLINYFYFKGCRYPEDLADQTINRVMQKIPSLDLTSGNKPISVFYGFASMIVHEELRKDRLEVSIEQDFGEVLPETSEPALDCLDDCLRKLPAGDEKLLREYYTKEKSDKFSHRQKLAEAAGLNQGALQTKLHRLRKSIRKCIETCLKKKM